MSIFRMLKATEQIQKSPAADGKLGFEPGEHIKLDSAEDMITVRILIHVLQDEPDKARALIRTMSPRDRALLSFHLCETADMVSAAESARQVDEDKRTRAIVRGEDTE